MQHLEIKIGDISFKASGDNPAEIVRAGVNAIERFCAKEAVDLLIARVNEAKVLANESVAALSDAMETEDVEQIDTATGQAEEFAESPVS